MVPFHLSKLCFTATVLLAFVLIPTANCEKPDTRTCAESIAPYFPIQNLNLDRILGEWFAITIGWKNSSHVRPNFLSCPSQTYSRQPNSPNIDILFKLRVNAENNKPSTDHGVAEITPGRPAYWNNVVFKDLPGRKWDEIFLATDYENFLIVYECEFRNNARVDIILLRSRKRFLGHVEKQIYLSFIEGLGWPKENFQDLPHPGSCLKEVDENGKGAKIPIWYSHLYE